MKFLIIYMEKTWLILRHVQIDLIDLFLYLRSIILRIIFLQI